MRMEVGDFATLAELPRNQTFILTNYRGMAISCSRTAAHTTSWVARASRCPVDPWENKNRSNGGKLHGNQEESRQEKETLSGRCSFRYSPKPLERSTSREAFPFSRSRASIPGRKTFPPHRKFMSAAVASFGCSSITRRSLRAELEIKS